jgi:carboxyl-terminal processing protease
VYSGGGIMPDVFVPADTSYNSPYFNRLNAKNVLNSFTLEYFDKNRALLTSKYKTFDDFKNKFEFSSDAIKSLIAKGEAEGVRFNEGQFNKSKDEILLILKGLVAGSKWQSSELYEIVNENDKTIDKALKVITDKQSYNKMLGNQ